MTRPFTFSAAVQGIYDGPTLADMARRAEGTGYTSLVVPDHLIPQLSPVPAMATIAAATTTLRIGAFVLNNDLRHPAVLAQDLASLDVLSGGRLDVAIGAGWRREEYEAIGLAFDDGPTRVSRLEEAVAVLKGCFGDEPFSHAGTHYTITDFDGQPKPVQRPHPPLLIGGGGKRILSIAGREAQLVGLAPRQLAEQRVDPRSITFAATAEKIAWARAAAGDGADDLTFNVYPSAWPVTVTDDARGTAREVIDHLRGRTGMELTETEVLDSPHLFIGSIEGLVAKFERLRADLGISSIMVGDLDELTPVVERLAGT
jgi:probable F420-dependent oxidoreductase